MKSEQKSILRIPPHNIEAEQCTLGSMLMDREAVQIAAGILKQTDFYKPSHGIIFGAMLDLYNNHMPIDFVTLQDKLMQLGQLENIGGLGYLGDLATITPTSAHIKQYATIVNEKSLLKKLINEVGKVTDKAYLGDTEAVDLLTKVALDISVAKTSTNVTMSPTEALMIWSKYLEKNIKIYESGKGVTGLATHIDVIDQATAGLVENDFFVLAARPSVGKSALGIFIAKNVAFKSLDEVEENKEANKKIKALNEEIEKRNQERTAKNEINQKLNEEIRKRNQAKKDGEELEKYEKIEELEKTIDLLPTRKKNVLYFSLEMSRNQLYNRIAASETYINSMDFKRGKINEKKSAILGEIMPKMANYGLIIEEGNKKINEIEEIARKDKLFYKGLDLVIVDYLQLVNSDQKGKTREQEVTDISHRLRALSNDLKCPVIALAQMNRNIENRQIKEPTLADLRESGGIEQDATLIAFLYKENENEEAITFKLEKNREGGTNKIKFNFEKEYNIFKEIIEAPQPEQEQQPTQQELQAKNQQLQQENELLKQKYEQLKRALEGDQPMFDEVKNNSDFYKSQTNYEAENWKAKNRNNNF